jgi:ribosomal protein L11 methyltransferase
MECGGGVERLNSSQVTMASLAKIRLTENDALALAAALDGDERLAALPVSIGEAPDGDWDALVHFSEDQAAESAALRQVLRALPGKLAPEFSIEALPDTDWVAKSLEGLAPVRTGRFLVHGRHDRQARRPNDIPIEIEAGQAFGTGHHGTTAGCLAAIDRLARTRPIANALDVGTGSGVLAIAIAKAAKASVLASDIDPVAVRVARDNIRLNGVAGSVRAVATVGLGKRVFVERAPYDLVVANILAGPLVVLAPQVRRLVAPGGIVVLSGLLPGQQTRVVAAYRGLGMVLVGATVLDGWTTLVLHGGSRNKKGEALRLRP